MKPLVLFAPGAGAPSTSPWMRAWAERLGAHGRVVTFDYPYMIAGRRLPDKLPVLVAAHRAALDAARGDATRVVLAGKSMGSRVGCHLAEQPGVEVAALVCFGYPLRSPTGTLRDEVLLSLATPILFVQGDRDPLCPLELLADVRARMTAPSVLHVVPGGDHGLAVRGGKARQAESDAAVERAVTTFLAPA
ncbi:MAG: alpha/beta fold hydrolase [Deltaproteobacteria bacterium]|nr:alpha/beta fold hydrolase [Deltaproteobacteria bacterium]